MPLLPSTITRPAARLGAAAQNALEVARFASGPAGSYANIKRTINHRLYAGFDELLELEAELQQGRVESADFMEAVMAFAQRREAKLAEA